MVSDCEIPSPPSTSVAARNANRFRKFSGPQPFAIKNKPSALGINNKVTAASYNNSCSNKNICKDNISNSIISDNCSSSSNNSNNCGSNNGKPSKKVIQAIDTNILTIKKQLTNPRIDGFAVKQTTLNGPVRITITNENEVHAAKATVAKANVSFHEFKWSGEKQKRFVIRGLVGTTEDDLPIIKQELCDAGLPSDISGTCGLTLTWSITPPSS